MKRLAALALAGGLLAGAMAAPSMAAPKPLWTDPAGDADVGQSSGSSIPGGFDLVSGSIAKNGSNLDFTVVHADMPPIGSLPEGFRFMWAFAVNGVSYRVTAKSVEVGKPNPIDQSGVDQIGQVYPAGFFRLEGDCGAIPVGSVSAVTCPTIAYLEGSFDTAAKSFTFSVPMKDVKAKPGSVLSTGAGDASALCKASACWTTHTAERSLDATVIDAASWATTYKIPKK